MKIQNNKIKTYLVVGLFLVAILVSLSSLGAVFAQVTIPNNTSVFSAQEDAIPIYISQEVSKMPQHSKDATFLNIEKRVHGFSGAYIDEEGRLNIYTTDHTIKSIDKSTLAYYVEPYHLAKGIIVKHSNHSWHKWLELQNIVTKLADDKALGINLMGVDDKNQVYEIGFEKLDNSKTDIVNKFLANHQIPSDMVKLVQIGKITPVNSGLTINPIEGGAEIGIPGAENEGSWGPTPVCTTGFIVKDSSGNYRGLTAGHCQASQNWNNGQQQYDQPYGGRYIGNEIAGTLGSTNSDSLLFTTSETGGFGEIYQYGYGTVTITGKAYTQLVGDTVCSSGTGSDATRCNSVTQTGLYIYDPGTGTYLSGQNAAGFSSVGGDSGSPVWNPNGGITVYGTVWGISGSSTTYYSPTGGIEQDQGVLQFN